ncbi:hypothetical protein N0V88_006357 [Collariella sp. IMI 366227]|nr:hypothetical protein N0V88_006357 [Collariella sp. IMI 366227]
MNLTAARLLLTTNSSVLCIGAIVLNPVSLARKPRAGITALQYAAWIGSVRMCKFLLQNLPEGLTAAQYMNHSNRRQQSAIHYAAAGGHIRTVGKFLLERGANFPFYEGQDASQTWVSHTKNDPLLLLCQQFRYNDAKWLVKFCRKLYANQSLDPSSLYTRALASLCKLRGPAECTQLSLRDQQDHLYDLMPKELESKVKRQVEASQPLRVAFGRRLISLGADPNKGESIVMRGEGTPLVPVLDNQYYTTYYTAIQTAAASGFTLMVEMLLSQGADLNITARHRQDLATLYAPPSPEALPLVLAALRTFANWMEPGDSLQTVRVLLEAGASLEDIRGCSILRVLQAKRFRFGYGRQKNWKQKDEDWVRTIEVFLDHGAAWKTSLCNWQKFVKCASIPGGLPLCQRLDHARPFENFDSATRREMLRHAVYSTCSELDNHRFFKARDDHALVLWVLNHCCMDPSKRFFIEPSRIQDIFGEVKNRGWKDIAEVIEPFMKQGQVLHLIPDN